MAAMASCAGIVYMMRVARGVCCVHTLYSEYETIDGQTLCRIYEYIYIVSLFKRRLTLGVMFLWSRRYAVYAALGVCVGVYTKYTLLLYDGSFTQSFSQLWARNRSSRSDEASTAPATPFAYKYHLNGKERIPEQKDRRLSAIVIVILNIHTVFVVVVNATSSTTRATNMLNAYCTNVRKHSRAHATPKCSALYAPMLQQQQQQWRQLHVVNIIIDENDDGDDDDEPHINILWANINQKLGLFFPPHISMISFSLSLSFFVSGYVSCNFIYFLVGFAVEAYK